ncbi:FkbM family methyltransferase [Mesorhizobium sp. M0088]|uniref:FkbM family methyltransferase n=1 Tax=Mesorhizobium sp. M0088 TaxID=2956873 RepID=UPI0033365A9E
MTGHRDQWFGGRTYAQHGDDLAILNIFKRLGIERPSYLDVGAYHPFDLSNTALLYERGSRGIVVEPNLAAFDAFVAARPDDIILPVGVAPIAGTLTFFHVLADPGRFTFDKATAMTLGIVRSEELPVTTLNAIVEDLGGIWPDLLSLDIEGLDIDVLQGATFGEGPKVVIVEADNGSGDTSHELAALMEAKGCTLHSWAGNNMIFIREADRARIC